MPVNVTETALPRKQHDGVRLPRPAPFHVGQRASTVIQRIPEEDENVVRLHVCSPLKDIIPIRR